MSASPPTSARELIVVRHGESEGNVAGLAQGAAPSPLTEAGRGHARAAARILAVHGWTPRRVITSPVRRCIETARFLTDSLDLPDATVEPALTEIEHGSLTGRTYADICDEDPEYFGRSGWWAEGFARWGGESAADIVARVAPLLGGLEADERVVLVTHGAVLKAIVGHLLGWTQPFLLELRYCTLARVARKRVGHAQGLALTHLRHADEEP